MKGEAMKRVLAGALLAVALSVGSAQFASAGQTVGHGVDDCQNQQACLYINDDYNGGSDHAIRRFPIGMFEAGTTYGLVNYTFNNAASSGVNKVANYRFKMWDGYQGGEGVAPSECLDSQNAGGTDWKDPHFGTGAPVNTFNDRAGAFQFQGSDSCAS
jgi:hypothetical protein